MRNAEYTFHLFQVSALDPRFWAGARGERPMILYTATLLNLMKLLIDGLCFLQSIKGYLI